MDFGAEIFAGAYRRKTPHLFPAAPDFGRNIHIMIPPTDGVPRWEYPQVVCSGKVHVIGLKKRGGGEGEMYTVEGCTELGELKLTRQIVIIALSS